MSASSLPRGQSTPTIDDHALLAVHVAGLDQLLLERGVRVAGERAAGADAVRLQRGGRGADGRDQPTGRLLLRQHRLHQVRLPGRW